MLSQPTGRGGDPGVSFALQPFPGSGGDPALSIQGRLWRQAGELLAVFVLAGATERLQLPEPAPAPERRDGLWQTTCLECFLALPDDPGYWELNVSPAGHWNLYRLTAYRQGLRPEPDGAALRLSRRSTPGRLEMSAQLALPPALASAAGLRLGVSAVIETGDGLLSYWALSHAADQPDFHRRETFLLQL